MLFKNFPFNNRHVFTLNITERFIRYNNVFHLSFGVYNTGNQVIHQGKKLYLVGNVNNHENYQDLQTIEYTQALSAKKMLVSVSKDHFEVSDYIMFN